MPENVRSAFTVLLGAALAACASTGDSPRESESAGPGAVSAPASSGAAGEPAGEKAPLAVSRHFAIYSDPLVNLHHFVYQWARGEAERAPGDRRRPVEVAERAELEQLPPGEQETLRRAVAVYRDDAISRDLLFDRDMRWLGLTLAAAPGAGSADFGALAALGPAVEEVEPLYLERFWPRHSAVNREWVAGLARLLAEYEAELAPALARAYGAEWPAEPIRVDATYYANWAGAYTSQGPDHITMSTSDPEAEGLGGLETLFHESSHTEAFSSSIALDLETAFGARGAEPPPMLWHALMFYTAGELARRAALAHGVEGYEPYAHRVGLYARTRWDRFLPALDRHWIPFLDGETDRETAYAGIAEELAP